MKHFTLATRKSLLALAQSHLVAARLKERRALSAADIAAPAATAAMVIDELGLK